MTKVHAVAERAALCVARLCRGDGLCGINALEGRGVGALEEEKRSACLGERVELLDLPGGRHLEVADGTVLIGETSDGVIVPDDGHVARARTIGGANDAPREVCRLHGRLHDELLIGLKRDALLDEQLCVEVDLVGEGLGREAALLVGHGEGSHSASFLGRRRLTP